MQSSCGLSLPVPFPSLDPTLVWPPPGARLGESHRVHMPPAASLSGPFLHQLERPSDSAPLFPVAPSEGSHHATHWELLGLHHFDAITQPVKPFLAVKQKTCSPCPESPKTETHPSYAHMASSQSHQGPAVYLGDLPVQGPSFKSWRGNTFN